MNNLETRAAEIKKAKHAAFMRRARGKNAPKAELVGSSPSRAQHDSFARAFDVFNAALFSGECPPCVLTFSRQNKRAHGYFAANRWANRVEPLSHEALMKLDLTADQAVDRIKKIAPFIHEIALNPSVEGIDLRDVASTLAHEMVHAWQFKHGKPSRGGYHNAEWAELMEKIGLMPSDTAAPGGKKVGQKMSHYVVDGGPFDEVFRAMGDDAFLPFREAWRDGEGATPATPKGKKAKGEGEGEGEGETSTPSAKSKRVYVCTSCGAKAWGKPKMILFCGCEAQNGTLPTAYLAQMVDASTNAPDDNASDDDDEIDGGQ